MCIVFLLLTLSVFEKTTACFTCFHAICWFQEAALCLRDSDSNSNHKPRPQRASHCSLGRQGKLHSLWRESYEPKRRVHIWSIKFSSWKVEVCCHHRVSLCVSLFLFCFLPECHYYWTYEVCACARLLLKPASHNCNKGKHSGCFSCPLTPSSLCA